MKVTLTSNTCSWFFFPSPFLLQTGRCLVLLEGWRGRKRGSLSLLFLRGMRLFSVVVKTTRILANSNVLLPACQLQRSLSLQPKQPMSILFTFLFRSLLRSYCHFHSHSSGSRQPAAQREAEMQEKGRKCHLFLDTRQIGSLLAAVSLCVIALIIPECRIKIFKADQKEIFPGVEKK